MQTSNFEDQIFMNITKELAKLSKCVSLSVAATLVEDGRIVATGVNGSVSGHDNCCDIHSQPGEIHSAWSNDYEIHAEMNLILDLSRSSKSFKTAKVYCTHSPCQNCLKHLMGLNSKDVTIKEIIFDSKYYRVPDETLTLQIEYAAKFGVILRKI